MLPYILAAVGGYLIGDSLKGKQYAKGGKMDDGHTSKKINILLSKLKSAAKNGDEEKFDKISNQIHQISDNQGLTESEYNEWDEIRSKENEKRIVKFSNH